MAGYLAIDVAGLAAALLGDPATVMPDEPVNGLDPEGVVQIRNPLTRLAGEGRTVFVSSHLMSERTLVAEHLIFAVRSRLLRPLGRGPHPRGSGTTPGSSRRRRHLAVLR